MKKSIAKLDLDLVEGTYNADLFAQDKLVHRLYIVKSAASQSLSHYPYPFFIQLLVKGNDQHLKLIGRILIHNKSGVQP